MPEQAKGGDLTAAVLTVLSELSPPVWESDKPIPLPNGRGKFIVTRSDYQVRELVGLTKKQRLHTFHDLRSFADWLKRHAAKLSEAVEILAGESSVEAALSPTDSYGDRVTCQLKYHPGFDAWRVVFGKPQSQKALHAFIRGALDSLGGSGDMLATELRTVSAVKGGDFESQLDERGFYHVTSASNRTELRGKIPSSIRVNAPVYLGVCGPNSDVELRYDLDVLLSMEIGDEGAVFTLTCPGLPIVLHTARMDAVAYLRSLLIDGFLVGLGELKLQEVPAIETP